MSLHLGKETRGKTGSYSSYQYNTRYLRRRCESNPCMICNCQLTAETWCLLPSPEFFFGTEYQFCWMLGTVESTLWSDQPPHAGHVSYGLFNFDSYSTFYTIHDRSRETVARVVCESELPLDLMKDNRVFSTRSSAFYRILYNFVQCSWWAWGEDLRFLCTGWPRFS